MPEYNGISMMPLVDWSSPDAVFASDACLTGCGAFFQGLYFHRRFPDSIKVLDLHINALELLTIVVCLHLWGSKFRGCRLKVYCDNSASVCVLNSGRTRDEFLQACLREVCFLAGRHEFELRAVHLSGVSNRLPDLLSRWSLGSNRDEFFSRTRDFEITECYVPDAMFNFTHDW